MTTPSQCPIPDIDRALSAYINSREESLKIRRALSKYLSQCLRPVNVATQSRHLNNECPRNTTTTSTNPPGLQNVRLSYLNALRALNATQTRHHQLKATLQELQDRHNAESCFSNDSQYESEITKGYVNLLRQRRCFIELQVVQNSLDKLLNVNPVNATQNPKTLISRVIGEQPDLPAERLDDRLQKKDDDLMLLKLKREVLEARASLDRANSARVEAQQISQGVSRLGEQVYALSRAREEMVDWVQEELAKMEEESAFIEDASPVKRPASEFPAFDLASAETQIQDSYTSYITSRSDATTSHESMQRPIPTQATQVSATNNSPDPSAHDSECTQSTKTFTKMLPHFPSIYSVEANERSMLQKAVYLQAQISSADEELVDSLLRMSGESHLLPSGSKGISSWRKTAVNAEVLHNDFVSDRLQESRQGVDSATTIADLCSLQSKVLASV